MVIHHHAKFDDHRNCGSGVMNIPAVTVVLSWMQDPAFKRYPWLYIPT